MVTAGDPGQEELESRAVEKSVSTDIISNDVSLNMLNIWLQSKRNGYSVRESFSSSSSIVYDYFFLWAL